MGCSESKPEEVDEVCPIIQMKCGNAGSYGCILQLNKNTQPLEMLLKHTKQIIAHTLDQKTFPIDAKQFTQMFTSFLTTPEGSGFKFIKYPKPSPYQAQPLNKVFEQELNGIRAAYSAWKTQLFQYTTFPNLPDNVCAFEFIGKSNFTLNHDSKFHFYETIYLFPQTFCGDVSDLKSMYTKTNIKLDLDQFYNTIFQPIKLLHNADITHNDIKLENILKCGNEFRIIDFGLTMRININKNPTDQGTPTWFHPIFNGELPELFQDDIVNTSWVLKGSCNTNQTLKFKMNDTFNLFKILYMFQQKQNDRKFDPQMENIANSICLFRKTDGGNQLARLYTKYCTTK